MRRGEVYWVEFPTGMGGEIRKSRPAVIVSNNSALRSLNRAQVVPFTSNTARVFPGETVVSFEGNLSKAMATHISTLDKSRIRRLMGRLDPADVERVDAAIRVQLGLR